MKNKIISICLLSSLLLTSCNIGGNNEYKDKKVNQSKVVSSIENIEVESNLNQDNKSSKEKSDNSDNLFEEVVIDRVVDGDTAEFILNGEKKKLRFIGVDTPETVHPTKGEQYYGKEASNFTKKSLEGKTVYLEKDVSDVDRYGRVLRYIWLEKPNDYKNISNDEIKNKMFNAILLKEGYAVTSTFPPDVKYESIFLDISRAARENEKGLWQNPNKIGEKVQKETDIVKKPKDTVGKIKGNKNSKIYHVPGGKSYDKVKETNAVYFDSEEEAKSASYRKAQN